MRFSLITTVLLAAEALAAGPISLQITNRGGHKVGLSKRSNNGSNVEYFNPGNRYAVEAQIGTPPRTVYLTLTGASSDLVTFDPGMCQSNTPRASEYPRFNSSTYVWESNVTSSANVSYGLGRDTVTVAGYTAENQLFASLQSDNTNSTSLCSAASGADGVFGISHSNQSLASSPFLATLLNTQAGAKEIGIFLSDRTRYLYTTDTMSYSYADGFSSFGELMIGGTNKSLYTGDFTNLPVMNDQWFDVPVDGLSVNGKRIAALPPNMTAELAPSDGNLFLPQAVVAEIFQAIPGSRKYDYGKNYTNLKSEHAGWPVVPCNSNATLSLNLGGKEWEVPMLNLLWRITQENAEYCILRIRPSDTQYSLGTPFMQTVYTKFTYDPVSVGIASLAPGVNTRTVKDLEIQGQLPDEQWSALSRAGWAKPTANATSASATSTEATSTSAGSASPSGADSSAANNSNSSTSVTPPFLIVLGVTILACLM